MYYFLFKKYVFAENLDGDGIVSLVDSKMWLKFLVLMFFGGVCFKNEFFLLSFFVLETENEKK
jgi:hypothetical protein